MVYALTYRSACELPIEAVNCAVLTHLFEHFDFVLIAMSQVDIESLAILVLYADHAHNVLAIATHSSVLRFAHIRRNRKHFEFAISIAWLFEKAVRFAFEQIAILFVDSFVTTQDRKSVV